MFTPEDRDWLQRQLTSFRAELRADVLALLMADRALYARLDALDRAITDHVTEQAALDALSGQMVALRHALRTSDAALATDVAQAPKG